MQATLNRVAIAALLLACAAASACSTPVCRYALENWPPDPYEAVVLNPGPHSPTDSRRAFVSAPSAHWRSCPTPSFTGFNTPSRIEADIADLQHTGTIPPELDGAFYRVQPDPQRQRIDRLHPLDQGSVAADHGLVRRIGEPRFAARNTRRSHSAVAPPAPIRRRRWSALRSPGAAFAAPPSTSAC